MDEVKELANDIRLMKEGGTFEDCAKFLMNKGYRQRTVTDESIRKAIEEIRALVNGCKPEIDRKELFSLMEKVSREKAWEITEVIVNNQSKILKMGGRK